MSGISGIRSSPTHHASHTPTGREFAAAFKKKYPLNADDGSLPLPDSARVDAAKLPKNSAAATMAANADGRYDYVDTYKISLLGHKVYVVVGNGDSLLEAGLFDAHGKKLSLKAEIEP